MDETTDAKIKVLVVEPLKEPYVREISGLDDMQAVVGGHIEAAYPFPDDNVAVVCNESGKIMGLPANRPIMDESGLIPKDIIQGTFFVAGIGEDDFISLSAGQIQRYSLQQIGADQLSLGHEQLFQVAPRFQGLTDGIAAGEQVFGLAGIRRVKAGIRGFRGFARAGCIHRLARRVSFRRRFECLCGRLTARGVRFPERFAVAALGLFRLCAAAGKTVVTAVFPAAVGTWFVIAAVTALLAAGTVVFSTSPDAS